MRHLPLPRRPLGPRYPHPGQVCRLSVRRAVLGRFEEARPGVSHTRLHTGIKKNSIQLI